MLTCPYVNELLSCEHVAYIVAIDTPFGKTGFVGYDDMLEELLFTVLTTDSVPTPVPIMSSVF